VRPLVAQLRRQQSRDVVTAGESGQSPACSARPTRAWGVNFTSRFCSASREAGSTPGARSPQTRKVDDFGLECVSRRKSTTYWGTATVSADSGGIGRGPRRSSLPLAVNQPRGVSPSTANRPAPARPRSRSCSTPAERHTPRAVHTGRRARRLDRPQACCWVGEGRAWSNVTTSTLKRKQGGSRKREGRNKGRERERVREKKGKGDEKGVEDKGEEGGGEEGERRKGRGKQGREGGERKGSRASRRGKKQGQKRARRRGKRVGRRGDRWEWEKKAGRERGEGQEEEKRKDLGGVVRGHRDEGGAEGEEGREEAGSRGKGTRGGKREKARGGAGQRRGEGRRGEVQGKRQQAGRDEGGRRRKEEEDGREGGGRGREGEGE